MGPRTWEMEARVGKPSGRYTGPILIARGVLTEIHGVGEKVNYERRVMNILECLCPSKWWMAVVSLKPPGRGDRVALRWLFSLWQKLEGVPLGELSGDFYSGSLSAMELVFAATLGRWLG